LSDDRKLIRPVMPPSRRREWAATRPHCPNATIDDAANPAANRGSLDFDLLPAWQAVNCSSAMSTSNRHGAFGPA
jgi:hypothetical protein